MKLTFWGAAREVTGSKHMVTAGENNYLLDCGLGQGRKNEELEKKNREFLVHPSKIKEIIVSHAHIDHTGLLPYFVKNGFEGEIHTTAATRDLCSAMLLDSAHIQELDFTYAGRHDIQEEKQFGEPLYGVNDIPTTMDRFMSYNYRHPHTIDENLTVDFFDAGHVLGSAISALHLQENGIEKKLVFTGDLGRKNLPILRDPTYIDDADYVIIESTYGNRLHDPVPNMIIDVEKAVNDAYKRGGKIIIPSFSLERTQEVIYLLHMLHDQNKIPDIPIFIDSPLSLNITQVFKMHPESYDQETFQTFLINQDNPFGFGKLKFVQSTDESKDLNKYEGTCIIVSSSGMCEAGRIRHHIANNIEDPRNMILIIGYQAEGTLGRQLVEKAKKVKIFRMEHAVNAEVRVLNSFSAHADKNDIIDWLAHVKGVQKVFLVHGEETQMVPLKETIEKELGIKEVYMPMRGEVFDL